ncbi:uncharacterized protein TRAVEDRAFT_72007 [Trametes versicolor FP-101664 SS1]|uniref:uncharacterized protein n=1 Tax=Trametes versicolor (strain FP-101664) TaxID=717944 RepID=UPI00046246D3|nr:uncharacterized protein TRAVEDRAFT_72007 [Trametes versicolor FP-101664 SS1]EIW58414.1 hypothetical protein TRAVEDRAFT_72007 [Trametes versicolor FP-101664 SS1]
MGSAQSVVSAAAALAIAGAIAYGFVQPGDPSASVTSSGTQPAASSAPATKKKQKKKASAVASAAEDAYVEPHVVSFPSVVPGGFDAPSAPSAPEPEGQSGAAPKSKKKKKAKKASSPVPQDAQSESSATAPESSAARKPRKSASATPKPAGDDQGWTRVETKKKAVQPAPAGTSTSERPPDISTSDAGITTSVTGTSSPVTERTEDEAHVQPADPSTSGNRRTLAEKLLPKPRKTGVEDLLEEPDYPQVARVMRIQPRADEQPAAGFSWGDYEDVEGARGTADDADGEDDGWGVVRTRRSRPKQPATSSGSAPAPASQSGSETLTKKQRQHAAKREAEKAAKAEGEAARLALLAQHKRELERTRMAEQAKASKKQPSGGMSAYVDENGKLVWQ